jgi:hypothetical protein
MLKANGFSLIKNKNSDSLVANDFIKRNRNHASSLCAKRLALKKRKRNAYKTKNHTIRAREPSCREE